VDETKAGERDFSRLRNALLLAAGTALLLAGFGRSQWYLLGTLVIVGLAVMLPTFQRLSPPGTLQARPGVAAAVAVLILLTIGFFGFEFFIPLALTDLRHQSTVMAGLPLTASALTWTAGAWIVDRRSKSTARALLLRTGLALIVIGILLTAFVFLSGLPVLATLPAWSISGLGMGISFSTLMLSVLDDAPEGSEGATISAGQLANTLGVSLGVGIGGSIVAATSIDEIATDRGFMLLAAGSVAVLAVGFMLAARIAPAVVAKPGG
jgi:predicted MFS family arabinose efflux permease